MTPRPATVHLCHLLFFLAAGVGFASEAIAQEIQFPPYLAPLGINPEELKKCLPPGTGPFLIFRNGALHADYLSYEVVPKVQENDYAIPFEPVDKDWNISNYLRVGRSLIHCPKFGGAGICEGGKGGDGGPGCSGGPGGGGLLRGGDGGRGGPGTADAQPGNGGGGGNSHVFGGTAEVVEMVLP